MITLDHISFFPLVATTDIDNSSIFEYPLCAEPGGRAHGEKKLNRIYIITVTHTHPKVHGLNKN